MRKKRCGIMAFDNVKSNDEHSIILVAGKELKICGVNQIVSFDEISVVLISSLGEIEITGSSLNIDALDLEKGFALITGCIRGINYIEEIPKKKRRFWG